MLRGVFLFSLPTPLSGFSIFTPEKPENQNTISMKKRLLLILLLLPAVTLMQARKIARPAVLPLPASIEWHNANYVFPQDVCIVCPSADSLRNVVDRFSKSFAKSTGLNVRIARQSKQAAIRITHDTSLGAEAYRLNVSATEGVCIAAARPAGLFYALQTLKQLFPRNVMAEVPVDNDRWSIRAVTIEDAPRYGWRGFMLDEGRHFFGKEEVKRVLDIMATYKMNRFHWHLTEDQGWRIEIKKYPLLTSVGAWRESKVLPWGDVPRDHQHYGGFYTQDDIREIVQYARERFIEILPEIDMPGHFQAALAAYPELSCDPEAKHEVWVGQGVSTDVMNVAAPQALQFTKDVVDELISLFPFGYLHLGGDECPTYKWERNELCKKRLAEIGSTKFRDLQTDFYKKIIDYIAAKPEAQQRKLIFWNEVLHGNTSALTGSTIMAWIGADGAAKEAAKRGFDAILTPQIPYYINRKQSTDPAEPLSQGHGTESLEAVYNYVPAKGVPADLQTRYLGVQANFWTEWVEEAWHLEYLLLPRLAAVAEAGWTPQEHRSYPDFLHRLTPDRELYFLRGYAYGRHAWGDNP